MDKLIKKAGVLIESLPYIREFYGKTFVIKSGGSVLANKEIKNSIMEDITLLKYIGVNPVIVHGGGPAINETLARVNKKSEFVNGLRITDKETMELVEMVLVGKVNKDIVGLINKKGSKGVGLSGKDGGLIKANKLVLDKEKADLGYVGEVKDINPEIIDKLITGGYIPVVAPVGAGEDGDSFNINADTVAGKLARSLKAEKLLFLTDVDGISSDHNRDGDNRVSSLTVTEAKKWIESGKIRGGMVPKVEACMGAISNGVNRTHILNGLISHALLLEIFTDQGIGTMILEEEEDSDG